MKTTHANKNVKKKENSDKSNNNSNNNNDYCVIEIQTINKILKLGKCPKCNNKNIYAIYPNNYDIVISCNSIECDWTKVYKAKRSNTPLK